MRNDPMHGVEVMAEQFAFLAAYIRSAYPTYEDGNGDEHFVPGPATAELREAAKTLVLELNHLRFQTAKPLPSFSARGK